MQMLKRISTHLFSAAAEREVAELYTQLVTESRNPKLYEQYSVPDTLEGRFDMIVLHLFIVLERGKQTRDSESYQKWSRILADLFFADMDRNLREMGAGDVGVARKVQDMGKAYYGRLRAYEAAKDDREKLVVALSRNVYENGSSQAGELAEYVLGKLGSDPK